MSTPQPRSHIEVLSGYHSPQVAVPIRLNTNESPYEVPPAFLEQWVEKIRRTSWNRYPDRMATELREAIGEQYGVPGSRVWPGNGSNELLQMLNLAFGGPGRTVTLFEPTYALHRHIAETIGATVVSGIRSTDFQVELDHACELIDRERPNLIMWCNPNNPTGTADSSEVLEAVLERAAQQGSLVVVDEAYGEFATNSQISRDHPNLAVLRTFSKVWSLAGMRLGFIVAPDPVIASLQAVTLPYHLSAVHQHAGVCALTFDDEMQQRVDAITRGRAYVEGQLQAMGVRYWSSQANFVLFEIGSEASEIWERLLAAGVLVRDCSSWLGLEGCLRVTIGTNEENMAFCEALSLAMRGE